MKAISTILVPFDFSEVATSALKYAIHFVENDPQATIILAHVNEQDISANKQKELDQVIRQYGEKLKNPIVPIIAKGKLIDSLLEIQNNTPVDLVVMGTCPVNSDCNLQTKTSAFVLIAKCPVLVIPNGYNKVDVRKISLIIDKEEIHNNKVLEVLLDVARRFNATVDVLTVKNEAGEYGYTLNDEKNENVIEYYLENFYSHHTFIEDPDIPRGIFTYVNKKDIDLIAMLPKVHAKGPMTSEGKLTQILSQQSEVPLLAIDI